MRVISVWKLQFMPINWHLYFYENKLNFISSDIQQQHVQLHFKFQFSINNISSWTYKHPIHFWFKYLKKNNNFLNTDIIATKVQNWFILNQMRLLLSSNFLVFLSYLQLFYGLKPNFQPLKAGRLAWSMHR